MQANTYDKLHQILICETSDFWRSHYTFKNTSIEKTKRISKSFADLLIINAVLPMMYAYRLFKGVDQDAIISIIKTIPSEKNNIVNAFMYHEYNEYCGKYDSDHYPVIIDLAL